jgi:hypothetical protein
LVTVKSVHRSLAILKLPKVVAQIITFAQNVLTAMTNNPKFPSPSPALSEANKTGAGDWSQPISLLVK